MLKNRLSETIEALIKEGVGTFLCGGAIGFDTLGGFAVLELKARHEFMRLVMVLPCREQDKGWSANDKAAYKELLAAADEIVYVSEEYTKDCMKKRNIRLVQDSDFCIAYMKYQRTGTAQTVRLANEKGISVLNLAE
ncbi:MAG: SLOG family protein [Oscillospiraceae bacterium]|nr:SLOG family protein [Oscillospiraceae bacterium]